MVHRQTSTKPKTYSRSYRFPNVSESNCFQSHREVLIDSPIRIKQNRTVITGLNHRDSIVLCKISINVDVCILMFPSTCQKLLCRSVPLPRIFIPLLSMAHNHVKHAIVRDTHTCPRELYQPVSLKSNEARI